MANRYADDIRRIVGKDDQDGSLAAPKDREKLLGGRGVGYYSGSGGQVSGTSGFTGDGSFGQTGNSANNPQGDNTTETAGGGGEGSGGTSVGREPPYDASDPWSLISYFLDLDGNQTDVDVHESMTDWTYNSPDALKVISGLDPTTGQKVELYLGTQSFPPPDGWDNPEVPPEEGPDPTWELGFYWETTSASAPDKYASPTEAAGVILAGLNDNLDGNVYAQTNLAATSGTTYDACYQQVVSEGEPIPPGPEFCLEIYKLPCGGGDPSGPGDYCTTVAPGTETPEFWPPIDKIVMNVENGIASLSDYQNPADTAGFTQGGNSRINLESAESPGTYYSVEPTGTGGTLVYETATPGGDPVGVYKTFDAKGQFTGFGDVSSIDYVRPDSK